MENITTSTELKNAIQLLEVEQYVSGQQLKEQLYTTYERFKTVNIIKSTLKEVISAPFVIDNILSGAIGMATGYFSNKILLGVSGKIFRKLFGSILGLGVKNVVVHPPDSIKSFGQKILQHFLHKKQSTIQP